MSFSIDLLDPATRPKAPKIAGVTPEQRRNGRRLALIHELHLRQLRQVRRAMEAIETGDGTAATLGEAVASLDMAANYRAFGNLCGEECGALTFHHTAEDRLLFPALDGRTDGLTRVIERLRAEHDVVHKLLEELETRASDLVREPTADGFANVREVFEALEGFVRSHFGYEQEELEEAIGFYQVGV